MNIWQAVWRLVRFAPWLFLANALLWIADDLLINLAEGLILRQVFNTLTNSAPLTIGLWGLLALFPAVAAAGGATVWGAMRQMRLSMRRPAPCCGRICWRACCGVREHGRSPLHRARP